MDINKRIERISKYFRAFNIAEGTIYVLIKMDKSWVIPSGIEGLNVKTADDENGTYFFVMRC